MKFFTIALSLFFHILFIVNTAYAKVHATQIAEGLESPWGMTFLPNGDLLVTERKGRIRIIRDGTLLPDQIRGVPAVHQAGQGGLMDIMPDRNFSRNQTLYLSYSRGTASANAVVLVKAQLIDNAIVNPIELFVSDERKTSHHYGARIVQLKDNSLLMTVGDGYNYREAAQRLDSTFGKIIRIDSNGKPPADNPFVNTANALPEIYSYGHRNQQGLLAVELDDGKEVIIEHEHGAKGGDEINLIVPGENYGWPVITLGIDYNGARISPFTEYQGMRQPDVDWTPSIAPSAMALYQGDLFPQWNKHLFITSLAEKSIRRVTFNGETVIDHGIVFKELGEQRFRDIETGPDGALYVLTDGPAADVLRITPAP